MTYELAKELKDAGFSQLEGIQGWIYEDGTANNFRPLTPHAKNPTLSELIEACGEIDFHLQHFVGEDWGAWGGREVGHGPNPEEAVARLWLALNRKEGTTPDTV
jgi:hypothetical protein